MSEMAPIHRGDVVIAEMSDARGPQIRKRRPYVIVSPDDLNASRLTYIVAPLTTGHHPYRFRVPCEVLGRRGHVVLDQLYTINAADVHRSVAQVAPTTVRGVLALLREMFAE
jgi:mRNA interferase MazF